MFSTRTFRIHYMAGNKVGNILHNSQCSEPFFAGLVAGKELVGTYGRSVRIFHLGVRLWRSAVAARMFVVPFASRHAAPASRVVRDVRQAVLT